MDSLSGAVAVSEERQLPKSRRAADAFTAAEVMARTGASLNQLQYWDKTGLVTASVGASHQGTGHPRLWSSGDLQLAQLVMNLTSWKVSVQEIRRVFSTLRAAHGGVPMSALVSCYTFIILPAAGAIVAAVRSDLPEGAAVALPPAIVVSANHAG